MDDRVVAWQAAARAQEQREPAGGDGDAGPRAWNVSALCDEGSRIRGKTGDGPWAR